MTRTHLTLDLLLQRLRRLGSKAQRRFVMMNLDKLDPLPLGPGWFDSSWELETGLEVCEARAVDVEFQPWLESAATCPPVPAPTRPPVAAAPARGLLPRNDNLIEFEATDLGNWRVPSKAQLARQSAELELVLA